MDPVTLALAKGYTDARSLIVLSQDVVKGYPERPESAQFVRWVGWSEPPISDDHPFDEWVQIPPRGYYTDFSNYQVDAPPHDWTSRWLVREWVVRQYAQSVYGGQSLSNVSTSGTGRISFSWDALDTDPYRSNVEVLMMWRTSDTVAPPRLMVRGSGDSGAETGYTLGCVNGTQHGVFRMSSGALTEWRSDLSIVSHTWYLTRVRAIDNRLMVKTWPYGTNEPEGWQIDMVDPNPILTPGWIGVHQFSSQVISTIDFVAVATGGREVVLNQWIS